MKKNISASDNQTTMTPLTLSPVPVHADNEDLFMNSLLINGYVMSTVFQKTEQIKAQIGNGTVTITIPETPPPQAYIPIKVLFPDINLTPNNDDHVSAVVHYLFNDIGVGANAESAAHLNLYWLASAIPEKLLTQGWNFADAEGNTYPSIDALIATGNKLYYRPTVDYTVTQSGDSPNAIDTTALNIQFTTPVVGLSQNDIIVLGGDANVDEAGFAIADALTGSETSWQVAVSNVHTGKVQVMIRKFGIDCNMRTANVFTTPFVQAPPQNFNANEWMAYIPNGVRLNELRIPGTHDSATWTVYTGMMAWKLAMTQNKYISAQLNEGIRSLDIRVNGYHLCKTYNPTYDKYILFKGWELHAGRIWHGDTCGFHYSIQTPGNSGTKSSGMHINHVINDCVDFLEKNPTETILLGIDREFGDESSYEKSVNDALSTHKDRIYNYGKSLSSTPTLKNVRGQIVLKSQLPKWERQNNWEKGDGRNTVLERANLKINDIVAFNRNNKNDPAPSDSTIRENMWSHRFIGLFGPDWFAKNINPKIPEAITQWNGGRWPAAIQTMDYYRTEDVISIIKGNPTMQSTKVPIQKK